MARYRNNIDVNKMDIPWYIKATYQLGIPAVIAGFLVWAMVVRIDAGITEGFRHTNDNLLVLNENLIRLNEGLKLHNVDSAYTLKEMERVKVIMRQVCVNTAGNNPPAINACLSR